MIETILVATDGSEAAGAAERFGISLARRLSARLSGITVVEDRYVRPSPDEGLGAPAAPDGIEAWRKSRADAVARRFSERARSESLDASCETVQGIADDRIVERAQSSDLVVIGRDGEHAPYRTGLIGSTAQGVLRKTNVSSVVVPPGAEFSGPLLLAFDGSPGSRLAAKTAVEMASRLNESIVVFVDSKDKGRAVARFDEVRRLLGSLSVPVREASSTLGRPDVKSVDAAREAGAGLIVMGAFGRNRITDYFLGSNAAAVVRTSPIAVLLAR
ncbi:MAG: universal stress protein [Deltaproteobacteria bacterium]|nr:universal stress protein [Deltaproteobacteria bacterium]